MFSELAVIDQSWTLTDIAQKRVPPTWEKVFKECEKTFLHMDKVLEGKTLYPLKKHLFRALDLVPLNQVKVILLGQDPYMNLDRHGQPQAVGLSFSVDYDNKEIPPSLQNIFKEISNSYPDFTYASGSLIDWAKQGVLLLNSALTYCPQDSNKPHTELWKHFIKTVLREVADNNSGCVAILLGAHAQKYASDMKSNIHVLATSHPSGRSAHMGFLGSQIFKNCNDELEKMGRRAIDWNIY